MSIKLPFVDLLPDLGNLWFTDQPPKTKEEGLTIKIEEGYIAYVFFDKNVNSKRDGSQGDSFVRDLKLLIEKEDPDPRLIEFIRKQDFTPLNFQTPEFTLFSEFLLFSTVIFRKIHEKLTTYIRNIKRQYWLRSLNNPRQYFLEKELDIHIILDGKTINFSDIFTNRGERPSILDEILGQKPITKSDLKNIEDLFDDHSWSPSMYLILITNSFQHFSENRPHEAIISAVTALENAVSVFFPRVLPFIEGGVRLKLESPREFLNILKERSLSNIIKKGLKLFQNEIISKNYHTILKAIDERNKVIHLSKRNLDLNEIKKYILAINDVIQTLWKEDHRINL